MCAIDFDKLCATNFTIFVKGALKSACSFNNNVSVLGGLRPPDPYWGSAPGPRWGLPSPRSLHHCVQYDFLTILGPASRPMVTDYVTCVY